MTRSVPYALSLAITCATLTTPADAQAFDEKHACYQTVQEYVQITGGNQAWSDAATLADYAIKVRNEIADLGTTFELVEAKLGTMPLVQRNEYIADLRQFNECIVWLDALLTRLEDRLRELGVNTLLVAPGSRDHLTREKYFQDVRAELEKGKAMVKAILVKRR